VVELAPCLEVYFKVHFASGEFFVFASFGGEFFGLEARLVGDGTAGQQRRGFSFARGVDCLGSGLC
jgi:hypothetical protein